MEQQLREDLQHIINEDLGVSLAAAGIAGTIVLGPWLIRQRKITQERKTKCAKFEGLAKKKCMIQIEIQSLTQVKNKLSSSMGQCNKFDEPKKSKCKSRLQGIIKDYDSKVAALKKKIG
jgi:seryl-tRNA synthetase